MDSDKIIEIAIKHAHLAGSFLAPAMFVGEEDEKDMELCFFKKNLIEFANEIIKLNLQHEKNRHRP